MDKYEYKLKAEHIKKLVAKKDLVTAIKICDSIDWDRVKDVKMLTMVSEIYESNGRYEEAIDTLLQAYEYAPIGRRIVYRLTELAIECGNYTDAENFYKEFITLAPGDLSGIILHYKLAKAKKAPLERLILILESYREEDFDEHWAYELAELYHKAGRVEDCVKLCDDIILWFGLGKYVEKAMKLKVIYEPLTEEQREKAENKAKYEARLRAIERASKQTAEIPVILSHNKKDSTDGDIATINASEDTIVESIFARHKENKNKQTLEVEESVAEEEKASEVEEEVVEETEEKALEMEEIAAVEENTLEVEEEVAEEEKTPEVEEAVAEEEKTLEVEEEVAEEEKTLEVEEAVAEEEKTLEVEEEIAEEEKTLEMEEPVVEISEPIVDVKKELGVGATIVENTEKEFSPVEEVAISREEEKNFYTEEAMTVPTEEEEIQVEVAIEEDNSNIEKEIEQPKELEEQKVYVNEQENSKENIVVEQAASTKSESFTEQKEDTKEAVAIEEKKVPEETLILKDILQLEEELTPWHFIVTCRNMASGLQFIIDKLKKLEEDGENRPNTIAKTTAAKLNKKDLSQVISKVMGKVLLIEQASKLSDSITDQLVYALEKNKKEFLVVLLDNRADMNEWLQFHPQIGQYFLEKFEVKEYTEKELVQTAIQYAEERDCVIDDMAMLALHARIEEIMEQSGEDGKIQVEEFMEEVIERADKKSFIGFFKNIMVMKYDEEGRLILKEQHFIES